MLGAMQPPPFGLVIFILFVCGVIIAVRSRKPQSAPSCPHCGATSLIELDRRTLDTRTVDLHSRKFMPGADIRLQLDQEVSYRCTSCQQQSTVKVTETP